MLYLMLPVLTLSACESLFFEPEPANTPQSNFMELWNSFDQLYAPFEQRGVDWDASLNLYLPQVSDQTTDNQLFSIFQQMLAPLDDGHVSLEASGRERWSSNSVFRNRTDNALFNWSVATSYLDPDFFNSFPVTYGTISQKFGYIHLYHVSDPIPDIERIMKTFRDLEGIIIDLRHNDGGDFANGWELVKRFTDQKRLAFTSFTKTGPGRNHLGKGVKWHITPGGNFQFTGNVVVLTDRYTVSAGERTLMALRVLPQVTVIGVPTSGAHGERVARQLPNGWVYSLTPQLIFVAEGISYEGIGIPPDIEIQNTILDINAGVDIVLEEGINFLEGNP